MSLTQRQIDDLAKIMGVEKEMIPLLHLIRPQSRMLGPWDKKLFPILQGLKIQKGEHWLDMPCGQGGVSVPLAKLYGAKITGVDIMPPYVALAKKYAKEKGVARSCRFKVGDIRNTVKEKGACDGILWIGAPHVFGRSKPTIRALRNAVRDGGRIVIADAYLNPGVQRVGMYRDYENWKETNTGYGAFGDEILDVLDLKGTLWAYDYQYTTGQVRDALKRAGNVKNREIINRFLHALVQTALTETKKLGLAIWVIRVRKKTILF